MSEVKASIVIDASREEVFKVVSDFESYPDFLPEIEEAAIEENGAKKMVVSFVIKMVQRVNCTLKFKLAKPSSITWELVEGDMMKYNNGSWKFKKVSAKKTEATYTADIGFGLFVPSSLVNKLIHDSLPQMLRNFKKRIDGA